MISLLYLTVVGCVSLAKKRFRTLVYCIIALILLMSVVISSGVLEHVQSMPHQIDNESTELLATLDHLPDVAVPSPSLDTKSQPPVVERYCDMNGFIQNQQQRSKQLLAMLSPEFKHIQHVFSANNGPAVVLSLYYTDLKELTLDLIIERLSLVHGVYSKFLPTSQNKSVTLNLVVLSDRTQYEDYTSRYGFDPRTSQGVFFHGSNSAFVEYKNDQQVIKTAVHEAVHAMNLRLIGLTPRWLNEGMAQLLSGIDIQNGALTFDVKKAYLSAEPHDIYGLLASESQWESIDTDKLYYSGWSWLSFLMGTELGVNTMTQLLRRESTNPCDVLSSDATYQILQNAYPTFEQAFYDWRQALNSRSH
ncbi:hypothetical protein HG263_05820 [Pseudoalteromonas sp. JBTF-M23]|uniref:DUF1570 domain-containing protein n=1 Tax=Pseudoalteromonas caenipelagi TaxID=2726988 RepID=A0A849VAR3_9GAMM|nr:hypothetical protein [Pseudoalteromonas caenipelagi]NOU50055.1 hypothetical protein [Pseudoalteromonas caenipelagi]